MTSTSNWKTLPGHEVDFDGIWMDFSGNTCVIWGVDITG